MADGLQHEQRGVGGARFAGPHLSSWPRSSSRIEASGVPTHSQKHWHRVGAEEMYETTACPAARSDQGGSAMDIKTMESDKNVTK